MTEIITETNQSVLDLQGDREGHSENTNTHILLVFMYLSNETKQLELQL